MKYVCSDESGVAIEIKADTSTEAAREYINSGDYYVGDASEHFQVSVWTEDDPHQVLIENVTVHPEPPACVAGEHMFVEQSVRGSNHGGVLVISKCDKCGLLETYDSGHTHPGNGSRVTTISYEQVGED